VILDRFRLTDKVAVVTGAGRGIGAATAVAFAEAGADVVISSRTESQLEEVAARVEQAGRQAAVVPADLSDVDAAARLAATARESFGRLDVVVNNVGGTIPNAFMKTSTRYLEEAFHFNVTTAHALTRAAVPIMLEGDGGAVVNISSVMGRVSGRGYLAYGTAKAALAHYTRLAARDLAPRIRVNAIGVGSVETSALEFVLTDDATRTTMEQATPLQRIGDPDDIAATALFLASPASAYLTGKVVEADGGLDQPNLDLGLPDLYAERGRSPGYVVSVAPVVRWRANQSRVRCQASRAAAS
jgi:7-alpha-hydroxysteroid dehydrogenase